MAERFFRIAYFGLNTVVGIRLNYPENTRSDII